MKEKYTEIFSLRHWQPLKHRRMAMIERAGQFSSFEALKGFDCAVRKTQDHIQEEAQKEPPQDENNKKP